MKAIGILAFEANVPNPWKGEMRGGDELTCLGEVGKGRFAHCFRLIRIHIVDDCDGWIGKLNGCDMYDIAHEDDRFPAAGHREERTSGCMSGMERRNNPRKYRLVV